MASARTKLAHLLKRFVGLDQLEGELAGHLEELYEHVIAIHRSQADLWRACRTRREQRPAQPAQVEERLHTFNQALHDLDDRVDQLAGLLQQDRHALQRDCHTQGGALQQPTAPGDGMAHLPSALREVVRALFHAERPLTCAEIAGQIEKSPATVRSYLHRLRERGFPLEIAQAAGGPKRVRLPVEMRRKLAIPG